MSQPGYGKLILNQRAHKRKAWHLTVQGTPNTRLQPTQYCILVRATKNTLWTHSALGSTVAAVTWHRDIALWSLYRWHFLYLP